jgi:hypothetical protein
MTTAAVWLDCRRVLTTLGFRYTILVVLIVQFVIVGVIMNRKSQETVNYNRLHQIAGPDDDALEGAVDGGRRPSSQKANLELYTNPFAAGEC